MRFSIISYSLRRTIERGDMDIFSYVTWCKENGFAQLDPWNEHLLEGFEDDAWLDKLKAAADEVGLPFGCIAIDGAHIYEPTLQERQANRRKAYRWLDVAQRLGASQVRLDAGGRQESFEEIFDVVVEGYHDLITRASEKGIEVVIENHWGPTNHPDVLYKLLDKVDGLGLLLDSGNWPAGTHQRAWKQYAKYARLTHIKSKVIDEQGNELTWDVPMLIRLLLAAGYDGCWGIESVPESEDEREFALKTMALMKRELAANQGGGGR